MRLQGGRVPTSQSYCCRTFHGSWPVSIVQISTPSAYMSTWCVTTLLFVS
jgi:hypothetical protein